MLRKGIMLFLHLIYNVKNKKKNFCLKKCVFFAIVLKNK